MVMRPGAVWITVSGLTLPCSSASEMVKGFITEPGSKVSVSTRLRSCAPVRLPRLFGLKVGRLTSASTSPVRASSTMMPPALALWVSTASFNWL